MDRYSEGSRARRPNVRHQGKQPQLDFLCKRDKNIKKNELKHSVIAEAELYLINPHSLSSITLMHPFSITPTPVPSLLSLSCIHLLLPLPLYSLFYHSHVQFMMKYVNNKHHGEMYRFFYYPYPCTPFTYH